MLTDRMGYKYKVTLDDKRILRLYNPLPVDMLPELGKLSDFALFGVDLRAVEKSDARKILENLQKLKNPENKNPGRIFKNFTRGHYERDVE